MQQGGSFGGEICVSWLHVPQCDLSDSMPRKPLALRHVGLPQSIDIVEFLSDHAVHIEVRSVDGNRMPHDLDNPVTFLAKTVHHVRLEHGVSPSKSTLIVFGPRP